MSSSYGRLAAIRDYWVPRDLEARVEVRVTDLDEILRELVRVTTLAADRAAPTPPAQQDDETIRILDEERDKLRAELAEAHAENAEQARLLGISGSVEARLLARVAELEREVAEAKRDAERAATRLELTKREATMLRNQRDELRLLLDKRPAMNAGLRESYAAWSASVATLDWLDEIDRARGAA